MFDLSIRRLIWKEYRAQRSLWIALAVGAVLLQSLALWMSGSTQGVFPFVIAYVLSACFSAACAAVLFAGEDEEGTHPLLLQLPLQPRKAVVAKLSFGVVAVVTFVCVTLLAAAVWTMITRSGLNAALSEDLSVYGKSIAGTFVWSVLFSLTLRRVLPAVVCTLVAEVITVGIVTNLWDQTLSENTRMFGLYFGVVGIVAVIDVLLALRWAAGAGELRWRAGSSKDWPAAQPRARWWLATAAWCARRGSPMTRELATLTWRELRGAVPFCIGWGLLGVLLVDLLGRLFPMMPQHIAFLAATPAVCGLMTCLGDQRRQTFRFLSDRGVSPQRVWFCKQAVWFTLAVCLFALFYAWDEAAASRFDDARTHGMRTFAGMLRSTVHIPALQGRSEYLSLDDVSLQWQFVLSILIGSFAVGQFASFWFRRTVLSAGVLLFSIPLLWAWHLMLVTGDVPLWIGRPLTAGMGTWPLTAALFAATLFGSGRWLIGNANWKGRLATAGVAVLGLIVSALSAADHRAHSIPVVDPGFDVQSVELASRQYDAEWSRQWGELFAEMRPAGRPGTVLTPDRFERIEQRLVPLADALAGPHGRLDMLRLSSGDPVPLVLIHSVLSQRGARLEAEGDLAGAWDNYLGGLRVCRYLAGESASWSDWLGCVLSSDRLLADIREWSRLPDQVPALLREANAELSEAARDPLFARSMLMNRYILYRQLLEHEGPAWERLGEDSTLAGGPVDGSNPLWFAALPKFERTRLLRLIAIDTKVALEGPNALPVELTQNLPRWRASMSVPLEFQHGPYDGPAYGRFPGTADAVNHMFQTHRAAVAGTAVVVALQADRLEQGAFPPTLADLDLRFDGVPSIDPSTGEMFHYQPEGFPQPVYLWPRAIVPAGQPLLWSGGPNRHVIAQVTSSNEHAMAGSLQHGEFYTTAWGSFAQPRHPADAGNPPVADPNQVWFLILGSNAGDDPERLRPSDLQTGGSD